jgi:hypothetical protein
MNTDKYGHSGIDHKFLSVIWSPGGLYSDDRTERQIFRFVNVLVARIKEQERRAQGWRRLPAVTDPARETERTPVIRVHCRAHLGPGTVAVAIYVEKVISRCPNRCFGMV